MDITSRRIDDSSHGICVVLSRCETELSCVCNRDIYAPRLVLHGAAAVTTPSNRKADILTRSDAGEHPAAIAAALSVTPGYIYGILRTERPRRPRKAREKKSELRRMIVGLRAAGIPPVRVAFLLQHSCTRAWVYKILSEG